MVDLFEELKDDIAEERWQRILFKYKDYIIGFIAAIIIITSLIVYYNYAQKNSKINSTSNLLSSDINEDADFVKYQEALFILKNAKIFQKENKLEEALAEYNKISSNTDLKIKIPVEVKEIANLKKAEILIELGKDKEQIVNLLSEVKDNGIIWPNFAAEILLNFYVKEQENDKARELVDFIINDDKSSESMKKRVAIIKEKLNRLK